MEVPVEVILSKSGLRRKMSLQRRVRCSQQERTVSKAALAVATLSLSCNASSRYIFSVIAVDVELSRLVCLEVGAGNKSPERMAMDDSVASRPLSSYCLLLLPCENSCNTADADDSNTKSLNFSLTSAQPMRSLVAGKPSILSYIAVMSELKTLLRDFKSRWERKTSGSCRNRVLHIQ